MAPCHRMETAKICSTCPNWACVIYRSLGEHWFCLSCWLKQWKTGRLNHV